MKLTKGYEITQCAGERRYGGIMTLGPVKWEKCKNKPVVIVTIEHAKNDKENIPICMDCWKEGIENKLKILKVEPIISSEK